MENNNNIELRTDEVREILKKMPHWTIRWGTSIIFVGVILLLCFTWFYRYPDLIRSEVVISASNPPAEIKARSTGKIIELLVANGEQVEEGKLLAVIENPAKLYNVLELENYLDRIQPFLQTFDFNYLQDAPQNMLLGEIGTTYSDMQKILNNYQNFIQQDFYTERIQAIDGQIEMKNQLLSRSNVQKILEEERYALASKTFKRDSQLGSQNIISMEDLENSRSQWLNAVLTLETANKEAVSTRSAIYELLQQKAALQQDYNNQLKEYCSEITKAYESVKSEVQTWFLSYVLISPIEGTASFNKVWAANQNIILGETVMTIVPTQPEGIIGKAYVPVTGAGKVKTGQRVNIKLGNYPYMEYGMLVGKVKSKAPVPVNNLYSIEIELPNQLTTNYGKTLDMQQELWGNCEIVTEDLRLIQRLIYPIKAIVEQNKR